MSSTTPAHARQLIVSSLAAALAAAWRRQQEIQPKNNESSGANDGADHGVTSKAQVDDAQPSEWKRLKKRRPGALEEAATGPCPLSGDPSEPAHFTRV